MPQLTTERKTKSVKLPQSGGQVEVYEDLRAADLDLYYQKNGQSNSLIGIVLMVIKDWDFTNDKNEKLPVTADNVKLLSAADFSAIVRELKLDQDFLGTAGSGNGQS